MGVKHVLIVFGKTYVKGAILIISLALNNIVCSSSKWLQKIKKAHAPPPLAPIKSVSDYALIWLHLKVKKLLDCLNASIHKFILPSLMTVYHRPVSYFYFCHLYFSMKGSCEILANSLNYDFLGCLIHIFLQDVLHFDSLIFSNTFLCNLFSTFGWKHLHSFIWAHSVS